MTAAVTTTSTAARGTVLYVCAARSNETPGLAEDRALEEGRALAARRDLTITTVISDACDEPVPQERSGWCRLRELAERGEVDVVIVRWPNAISTRRELRGPEVDYLNQHGVEVVFSWAPLTAEAGESATR